MILDPFLLKFSSSSKVCLLWIQHSYFCAIFYGGLGIFINVYILYPLIPSGVVQLEDTKNKNTLSNRT